ncbi:MAG: TIGR01212 family radical SAM protein, partial [Clostridia bacterium]|nr:TIGR01212 family radical SAM protein [Clostridia bacterium]
ECGAITPMNKSDYIDVVCRQLSVLPPTCVIERLTGDGPKNKLLAPRWSSDKISVLAGIDKEMQARSMYQGEFFQE